MKRVSREAKEAVRQASMERAMGRNTHPLKTGWVGEVRNNLLAGRRGFSKQKRIPNAFVVVFQDAVWTKLVKNEVVPAGDVKVRETLEAALEDAEALYRAELAAL